MNGALAAWSNWIVGQLVNWLTNCPVAQLTQRKDLVGVGVGVGATVTHSKLYWLNELTTL